MTKMHGSNDRSKLDSVWKDNLANFRDLGDLPVRGRKRITRHRLFRSGTFAFLPKEKLRQIAGIIGPATYFDLRTPMEVCRDGSLNELEEMDFEVERFPIDEFALDSHAVSHLYDQVAQEILKRKSFVGPVIITCSLGKDRTGQVVARLLHALGVSRQEILSDFLRSNIQLKRQAEKLPERFNPNRNGYDAVRAWNIDFSWGAFLTSKEAQRFFVCD